MVKIENKKLKKVENDIKIVEKILKKKNNKNYATINKHITIKKRKCKMCGIIPHIDVDYDDKYKFYFCKRCLTVLSYNVKSYQLETETIPEHLYLTMKDKDKLKKNKGTYKRAPINAVKKAVSRLWRNYERSQTCSFDDISNDKKAFTLTIVQRKSSYLKPKRLISKYANLNDFYPENPANLKKHIINRKKFTYNAFVEKKKLDESNPMKSKMGKDYILDIKIYSPKKRNIKIKKDLVDDKKDFVNEENDLFIN